MKKLFLLLTLSLFTISFVNAQEEEQVTEIIFNDNIQDTFFGVKFGATEEELVEAFIDEGFLFQKHSADINIHNSNYFTFWIDDYLYTFGGFYWDFTTVYLCNNKVHQIAFSRTLETKEIAVKVFESIMNTITSKYYMYELLSHQDENLHKHYRGYSKDGKSVGVLCKRVVIDELTSFYEVRLYYSDENFNTLNEL